MNNVSVVIVTKNRKNDLSQCLLSLVIQSKTLDELVIIDNNSTDGTSELVESFSQNVKFPVRYFCEKRSGYPVVYNSGLKRAKYQWVAFIDDDCIADANWYKSIKSALGQYKNIDVLLGYSDTFYQKNIYSLATFFFQDFWKKESISGTKISNYEILDNKNIVYNNEFLSKHKLSYNEGRIGYNGGAAEDCELGERIFISGGVAKFEKKMKVFHKDPTSFAHFLRKYYFASASYENFKHGSKVISKKREKKLKFRIQLFKFFTTKKMNFFLKLRLILLTYFTVVLSFILDTYLGLKFSFHEKQK